MFFFRFRFENSNIACVIFRTIVLIFIVDCCNTTFRPLYPLVFFQVSLVYLGMEMIQPDKSFLKFDCWSNKIFKKHEEVIQNNDVIVFHVYQPNKHHEKFLEKHHEMNLKHPIVSVILDILKVKPILFGLFNCLFQDCVHFIENNWLYQQLILDHNALD